jgi:hypothetical protein
MNKIVENIKVFLLLNLENFTSPKNIIIAATTIRNNIIFIKDMPLNIFSELVLFTIKIIPKIKLSTK